MDVEGTLKEIVRDLGRFEARLEHGDEVMSKIASRLDAIDNKLSATAHEDALRTGMLKGGWWVLGSLMMVVATMSSFLTSAFKQWLGTP